MDIIMLAFTVLLGKSFRKVSVKICKNHVFGTILPKAPSSGD